MTNYNLPTNIDSTYTDSSIDATVKAHQQAHDSLHGFLNRFDTGYAAYNVEPATWIPLGDSITQQNDSWAYQTSYTLGRSLKMIRNAAIGGQTSAQMLSRINSDVISYSPRYCVLDAGTNDIGNAVAFATWRDNMKSMIGLLQDANIIPIMMTLPASNTHAATHALWNNWIRTWCANNQVHVFDIYPILVDPTNGHYSSSYDVGEE